MKKKINSKFMLISAIAIIVMAICAMVLFYDILKKQILFDLGFLPFIIMGVAFPKRFYHCCESPLF